MVVAMVAHDQANTIFGFCANKQLSGVTTPRQVNEIKELPKRIYRPTPVNGQVRTIGDK